MSAAEESDFLITPLKRVSDWQLERQTLTAAFSKRAWEKAFDEYLMQRLQSRYFDPISTIEKNSPIDGAGFSIITIYCSLIEFLQALGEGKEFQYGAAETAEIYSDSQGMFVRFLTKNQPFADCFTKKKAQKFYSNVRCALFHEARTRSPWLIKLASKQTDPSSILSPINCDTHRIYRDKLKEAFCLYLKSYQTQLLTDTNEQLRGAFIRKYDALCALK